MHQKWCRTPVSDCETRLDFLLEIRPFCRSSEAFGRGLSRPTAKGYHGRLFTVQQHFTISRSLFHRDLRHLSLHTGPSEARLRINSADLLA